MEREARPPAAGELPEGALREGEALQAALVGGWTLVRWEVVYDDGRVTRPFGERPLGLILYAPDGWMSASIMAPDRPRFSTANPREAPAEERARAYDGWFGYAGRWHVEGARVVHAVTLAPNPAMVGTAQIREARLDGAQLTLSATEPLADGATRTHRIVWRR